MLIKKNVLLQVTIIADVEYSCVVFRADQTGKVTEELPKIRLRRWCSGGNLCSGFGFSETEFYVEIKFKNRLEFSIRAYGEEAKFIDPARVEKYMAPFKPRGMPIISNYLKTKKLFAPVLANKTFVAYGGT